MTPSEFIEILNRPLADLPHELEMIPLPGPFNVEIRPPGSKSLTNRALLLAALAQGESLISGALIDADDAQVMIEALRQLGAGIEIVHEPRSAEPRPSGSAPESASLRIRGTAGRLRGNCTLNLKNAGTATRFLTAAACLADGPVIIDGNERMRQRPIGELVSMLRQLGVTIDELGAPGCVPLRIHPCRPEGGELHVPTTASSQYVSALMMVAPLMKRGLTIIFLGPVTSPSYMMMTLFLMMQSFGYEHFDLKSGALCITPISNLIFPDTSIEPDASGATYFWGATAPCPTSRCVTPGLSGSGLQADGEFVDVLAKMGSKVLRSHEEQALADWGVSLPHGGVFVQAPTILRSVDIDGSRMPDSAMTLAAIACFVPTGGTTTITGLRTLRAKETDRLAAMQTELSKLGVSVEIFQIPSDTGGPPDEGLRITPPPSGIDCSPSAPRIVFDTYDDHRMAMSLALIGLRRPNVAIRDPACVAKTYPTFWAHLSLLYSSAESGGALTRSD